MKLYARPASPFVRKVRVTALETGQESAIEVIMMGSPEEQRERVPKHNPLGKIPALVLDDGRVLYDSRVCCEYLDARHAGPPLFPPPGPERWEALRLQALGDGIGDAAVLIGVEEFRPEEHRSEGWVKGQTRKITRSLDTLDSEIAQLDGPLNIGQIAVACGIGYVEFRVPQLAWKAERPGFAAWYDDFCERPSMKSTFFARPGNMNPPSKS